MAAQAYDQHLNMVLGQVSTLVRHPHFAHVTEVEETITSIEIHEETLEEIVKV